MTHGVPFDLMLLQEKNVILDLFRFLSCKYMIINSGHIFKIPKMIVPWSLVDAWNGRYDPFSRWMSQVIHTSLTCQVPRSDRNDCLCLGKWILSRYLSLGVIPPVFHQVYPYHVFFNIDSQDDTICLIFPVLQLSKYIITV